MTPIRERFDSLPDKWKAALRTAWQSLTAAFAILALAVLAEGVDLLNGGSLTESASDLSNASRVLGLAVISIATGLVSLYMNRGGRGASYDRGA